MSELKEKSIPELKTMIDEAQKLIDDKSKQAVSDAYTEANLIAETVGLTLQELIEQGSSPVKKERKKVDPRYRSQVTPDKTWTGRGKKPNWLLKELENPGVTLESLEIKTK